jgi:hypothetical protein
LAVLRDDVISGAVEQVTVAVLDALSRDEAPTSAALRFLLRAYAATGRDDVRDAIEPALARALELAPVAPLDEQPRWLFLLTEAAAMSGDDRLPSAAAVLVLHLRSTWGRDRQPLDVAAAGVDACLRTAGLVSTPDLTQSAIDELERIVGAAYQPGCGVSEKPRTKAPAGFRTRCWRKSWCRARAARCGTTTVAPSSTVRRAAADDRRSRSTVKR